MNLSKSTPGCQAQSIRFRVLRKGVLGVAILGGVLFTACGGDGDSDPTPTSPPAATATTQAAASAQRVKVDMRDFAYTVPETLQAGWVEFQGINTGAEPHHAQIARLNEGVTLEQLTGALQQGPEVALGMVSLAGGIGTIGPGGTQNVALELAEGQYVMLCFVAGEDGTPHLAKGMLQPFQVVAPSDGTAATSEPESDLTIDMRDFAFTVPESMAAGRQRIKVTNTGDQPHEFILMKLAEGKTLADLNEFMAAEATGTPIAGEMPAEEAGGAQAISGGGSEIIDLDLAAGNYVAICFIPDPATGTPHLALGMVKEFTVS